jgi:hypothetical protein
MEDEIKARESRATQKARSFAIREGGDKSYRLGPEGHVPEKTDMQVAKEICIGLLVVAVLAALAWWAWK